MLFIYLYFITTYLLLPILIRIAHKTYNHCKFLIIYCGLVPLDILNIIGYFQDTYEIGRSFKQMIIKRKRQETV